MNQLVRSFTRRMVLASPISTSFSPRAPSISIVKSVVNTTKYQYHATSIACGKMKTKKAAAKRIIRLGSGKLKRGQAGKQHINAHKDRRRLARLRKPVIIPGVWAKKMHKLLPGSGRTR